MTEFTSDGCTGFVDVWRGIDIRACCEQHDLTWWDNPGDWGIWFGSNIDLMRCLWDLGVYEIAILAFIATMTIGGLLFMTSRKHKRND